MEVRPLIEAIIQFFSRLPLWLQVSWAGWVVLGLAVFIVSLNHARASEGAEAGKLTGKFVRPSNGETVSRRFEAEGTAGPLGDDQHLWLAVENGDLYWPKEPEVIPRESEWQVEVREDGAPPGGGFSLVLIVVGEKGQRTIRTWLDRGNRTGDFPGFKPGDIPGMEILDSVDLRLQ